MRRGRKKKDYLQWWMDRITTLKGFKEEAARLYNVTKTAYRVGSWALLKLAILAYYVDLYTGIIKKIFGRAYYLDVFAGPGINIVKGTNDLIFGSPIIADRAPKPEKKFDKLILIERKEKRAMALHSLLPNATIIKDDVNSGGLDKALNLLRNDKKIPFLAFVDPEGLEMRWSTLQLLLDTWSDVIINYQPSAVNRAVGSGYNKTLTNFFGTEEWTSYQSEEEYNELYIRQITRHKDYAIPIKVRGPRGFHYYIIVAVRKTSGTQPWINAVHRAKENIEKADYKDAETFLRIFKGEQLTLF